MAEEVVRVLLGRVPPSSPALLPNHQRLNIRGRVYPTILPIDGSKVPGKVWKGITDGELDVLDTFEDEEYVREVVGISLTDSADTMIAYAYIWGNVDDPDLYGEWDFDIDGPADARDLGSPSPFGSSLSSLPSSRGARDQRPDASTTELLCCHVSSGRPGASSVPATHHQDPASSVLFSD